MKKSTEQLVEFINKRVSTVDYFLARLQWWGLIWTLPFCSISFLVGGFFLMNFQHAMTPIEALALGYSPMPFDWEAGVFSHGSYFRWYLPGNHPVLYAVSWIMAIGPFFYLLPLMIAVSLERLAMQDR